MSADDGANSISVKLTDLIDDERQRLRQARAILTCARVALLYEEEDDPPLLDYADVLAMSAEMIGTAIDGLDSVRLQRKTQRRLPRKAFRRAGARASLQEAQSDEEG